jgi:tetratricopeptide (TPR) repeat protein
MRVKPGAIWRADGGPWQGRRADGELWEGRGGAGGAYFDIREAATLEDRKRQLHLEASLLSERGAYEQALELRRQLVALDPEDLASYVGLGEVHYRLRQYREAVVAFERYMPVLRQHGWKSLTPYMLAQSYLALGEEEKARETFQGILVEDKIEPELARLRADLQRQEAERKARAGEEP